MKLEKTGFIDYAGDVICLCGYNLKSVYFKMLLESVYCSVLCLIVRRVSDSTEGLVSPL